MTLLRMMIGCWLSAMTVCRAAGEECAALHADLNDTASVVAGGGVIDGDVTFEAAVNGQGAVFNGPALITYPPGGFDFASGSVAMWVRKDTTDTQGGILQIGSLGQPDSIGVFYVNGTDVVFEVRGSTGALSQVHAPGVLSPGNWTHVVVSWLDVPDGIVLSLIVNGGWPLSGYLSAPLQFQDVPLQLGYTGYYLYGDCSIDELRFFDYSVLYAEAYAEYVYSSNRFRLEPIAKPVSTGPVQIIGRDLYVAGAPFKVKGVGYAPTPIGCWPGQCSVYTNSQIIARDVQLLQAMKVNTIRTWGPLPDTTLLDALYYNGAEPIYAIVGFWVQTTGIDYGDPQVIAQYENQFRSLVSLLKDHPGVLGWGLGNEINIHHDGEALAEWYALANHLAWAAYDVEGDTYHPTILVNGDMMEMGNIDYGSDDASLNYVDMWGHNTYYGWDGQCYFDYYNRISSKPLIFTEYGIDAWDNLGGTEHEAVQAAWVVQQWRQISEGCAGASLMAYSDEWWKADQPNSHDFGGYSTPNHPDGYSNEEWWGALRAVDNGGGPDILEPRLVFCALAREFACPPGPCPADFNANGVVNASDLAALLGAWGTPGSNTAACCHDLSGDNAVNASDLALLLGAWGPCSAE